LRVKHYIKNLLVFLPLFFDFALFRQQMFIRILLGFVSFCLLASIVYIINDLSDIQSDRRHKQKKNRPLAKGSISSSGAKRLLGFLILVLAVINYSFFSVVSAANLILLIYLLINVLYSAKFKHLPLWDISILSLGYFLRVLYGSVLIAIPISNWMYLTILSMSLYLGFGKRRNELLHAREGEETRAVLKYYNYAFLDKSMYAFFVLTLTFYCLWASEFSARWPVIKEHVLLTVPVVIILCLRYNLLLEQNESGDPTDVILSDNIFLGLFFLLCLGLFFILYFM
jgi:4-hydroxybenzoate polyprenyltransferase